MAATTSNAPKYTVSFNSDTSDSEEETCTETETESESEETEEESPKIVTEVPASVPQKKEVSPVTEVDTTAEFTFDLSYDSSVVNGIPPSPVETKGENTDISSDFEFTFNLNTDTKETVSSLGGVKGGSKNDIQLPNGTISDDIGSVAKVILTADDGSALLGSASEPGSNSPAAGLDNAGSQPATQGSSLAVTQDVVQDKSGLNSCPGPSQQDALDLTAHQELNTPIKPGPQASLNQDKLSIQDSHNSAEITTATEPGFGVDKTMTINTEVEQSVTIETENNGRADSSQLTKAPDDICQVSEPPDQGNNTEVLSEVDAVGGKKRDVDLICLDDNLPLPKKTDDIQSTEALSSSSNKHREFAEEHSKSMDTAVGVGASNNQKTRLFKTKSLPESPIQSPKYKSAADDDFEARISRAKAFIESSNGRYSLNEDKASNVSTTSSQPDVKEVSDSMEDQYVLGTVAVTTGDREEDPETLTSTERSRRRKEDVDDIDARVRDISEDTNELIKRILAEARGEKYEPPEVRSKLEEEVGVEQEDVIQDHGSSYGAYGGTSSHSRHDDMGSMSLLERRIESMKKRNAELQSDDFGGKPKRYSYTQPQEDQGQHLMPYDYDDNRSTISSRAESIRRKYRENWGHQQHFEGDDEVFATASQEGALVPYIEPEEDDSPFAARRALMRQFVLPDEAFMPHKSEDTDDIVQERTADIRNVVSKQETVLEELRKASQSFEEIEDEIKEIRQMFYESQERRNMIHEEIEYDLQVAKENEEALKAQAFARRYAPLPEVDYTKGILPSQNQPLAISWHKEGGHEEDFDDTTSISSQRGLALGRASGWAGPGTRLSTALSLDQGRDNFDSESFSSMPSYRSKGRPSSARRPGGRSMYDRSRARSLMEDYDNPSDMGDDHTLRDDDGDTLDGMGDARRPYQKANGDILRARDQHNQEDNVDVPDELSAKINSWRAKNEAEDNLEVGEDALSFLKADKRGQRSYLENGEGGSARMPMQNGIDSASDYGSMRNNDRYGLGSTDNGGSRSYGLYNGDESGSTGISSWRSRQEESSDSGVSKWKSKYAQDRESATSSTPKYSWQRGSSTLDTDTSSYSTGRYSRIGKNYSVDDADTTPSYTSPYTSRFSRSSTLSDYDFPRPDRRARARSCEPVGFRSKFLDKVREQKSSGESTADKTRSKPFKSRFLRASFNTDTTTTAISNNDTNGNKSAEVAAE